AVLGDHLITRWDVVTGEQIWKSGKLPMIEGPALSPDRQVLASAAAFGTTLKLLEVATGQERQSLPGHSATVRCVAFSGDGRLRDVAAGKQRRVLRGHRDRIYSAAFSPDGKRLATGGWDPPITLWDPATGEEQRPLHGHASLVYALAWSPDGQTLASGSNDR